jgi:hypothetical protein
MKNYEDSEKKYIHIKISHIYNDLSGYNRLIYYNHSL